MKLKSDSLKTIFIIAGFSIILVAISCSSQSAAAAEKKITVPKSEVPPAIIKVIKQAFGDAEIIAIEKEIEGEDPGQYDFEIVSDGKEYELEVSPQGVLIEAKQVGIVEKEQSSENKKSQEKKWTKSFGEENCTFSSVGSNRFFILEPGYQLVLQSRKEKVVITVLDETKNVGGVETRIVEEYEEENGELKEISRNFFAICEEHGDVFYFGEEEDDYKDGKIVSHSGAWRADEKDSKAGIIMPGTIFLGARHYQEISPNAMDRAEIISDDVTMTTPAGTFKNCIRVEETSALEPGGKCYKTYAPGIGMIQDEDLLLTKYGKIKEESVSLDDLPLVVLSTIKKHAAGGKITEVEKTMAKGTDVYEAEVVRDGKEFDILVSAAGKYLGTEEETDDHQDEDDDDN